jgi:hypothetical protein
LERLELRNTSQIPSCNDRDGLHLFDAKLETELSLLCCLAFRATITDVLIERMRGEARQYFVEPLSSRGEIDARERSAVLIEKVLPTLQSAEDGILCISHDFLRSW